MIVEDQSEVIAFLVRPETHGVESVERVDTHGAVVVLAGDKAYKLKRAVKFPYMDFSTVERRRRVCLREIRLNRRTAPGIYRAAVPIARLSDGGLAIGGDGPAVDWLVEMRRFDQETLFDRMAARGALDAALIEELADAVAAFHAAEDPVAGHGGAEGIRWVIDGNDRGLREAGAGLFDPRAVSRLRAESMAALDRDGPLLDRRRADGFVRHCHGDLHLRNICLFDGRPTLFDAIEFNDEVACIDVLYDFAFLLMDLDRVGLADLANLAFNRYLSRTGDLGGFAALPLFLSCRAGVAAQVGAAKAAAQSDPRAAETRLGEARAAIDLALEYLRPPPARLVAVGGLSGTGKSTLARGLAPALGPRPGAVVVRSDLVRKELMGVPPTTRLGAEGYASDVNAAVYETVRERARAVLTGGHGAVVDAVYARPEERAAIEDEARETGVGFDGLWLEAPRSVLESRVEARRGDASDATREVVRRQLGYDLGRMTWQRVSAEGPPEAVLERARRALRA